MWMNPFVLSPLTSRLSYPTRSLYSSSFFPTLSHQTLLRSIDSLTSSHVHREYEFTQDDQAVSLRLDVPGLHLDQVQVEVKDRTLKIELQSPDLKLEEDARCVLNELQSSSTRYQFTLPVQVDLDQIQAELKQGQLFLTLPKVQPIVKTIQIQEGLSSNHASAVPPPLPSDDQITSDDPSASDNPSASDDQNSSSDQATSEE